MPQLKAVRTVYLTKKPGQRKTQDSPAVPPEIEIIERGKTFDASAEDAESLKKLGVVVEGDADPVPQPSTEIHTTGFNPALTRDPEGAEATAFSTPERLDSDEKAAAEEKAAKKPGRPKGTKEDGSELI